MADMIKVKPGIPEEMNEGDNPTYDEWICRINYLLTKHFGITVMDLPDCDTYEWYASERLRPIHAANRILENAGTF